MKRDLIVASVLIMCAVLAFWFAIPIMKSNNDHRVYELDLTEIDVRSDIILYDGGPFAIEFDSLCTVELDGQEYKNVRRLTVYPDGETVTMISVDESEASNDQKQNM